MYTKSFVCIILIIGLVDTATCGWETAADLNINASTQYGDQLDLYSDTDGNHLLLHEGDEITYYLFSYSGSQIRSSTIIGSISENPRFAKIAGYGGYVYIVYIKNDTIFTRRFTNTGQSWSTSIDNIPMTDGNSNGFSIYTTDYYLHIAWSEYDDSSEKYDSYHNAIAHTSENWSTAKRVTDSAGDYGGFPSVAVSASRIHVAYTQSDGESPLTSHGPIKTRDNSNSVWQTPQTQESTYDPFLSFIIADGSKLHCFYFLEDGELGQYHSDLYTKNRSLSSSTWSNASLLKEWADVEYSQVDLVLDSGNPWITYSDGSDIFTRKYINSWGDETEIGSGLLPRISSDHNDIYVIWSDDDNVMLRQYDTSPPAPTISLNTSGEYPVLTWNKVALDAKEYKVYRKVVGVQDWHLKTTTSNLTWTDTGVFLEFPMMTVYYRVQAYDQNDNTSGYSNEVTCSGDAMNKPFAEGLEENNTIMVPDAFNLRNNFPNPFNPGTTIEFDLPEDNHVNLVVFNLNGQKVANLVEAFVPAGSYKINFNAVDLPSGMYFYQITAGEFRDIKRMLLIK